MAATTCAHNFIRRSLSMQPQRLVPDAANTLHRTSVAAARSHVATLLAGHKALSRPSIAALLPTTGLPVFRSTPNPAPRHAWQFRGKIEAESKTMRVLTGRRLKFDILDPMLKDGQIVIISPDRARFMANSGLQDLIDSKLDDETNRNKWTEFKKLICDAGTSRLYVSIDYLSDLYSTLQTKEAQLNWQRGKDMSKWMKYDVEESEVDLARQIHEKRELAFKST